MKIDRWKFLSVKAVLGRGMTRAFWFLGGSVVVTLIIIYQYLPLKQLPIAYQVPFENYTFTNTVPISVPSTYTIEEADFCLRNPDLQIIAYIHSTVRETEKRKVTRETWARASLHDTKVRVGVVFMVGLTTTFEEEQIVQRESRTHRDIIQGNYTDSYHTLSYKALASLKWVASHCSHVPWTLHADDDILLDLFLLTRFLKVVDREDSFLCYTWKHSLVRRSGRWLVQPQEFQWNMYPPYCSGAVWILATRLIQRLLNAAGHSPFLWVDDVYITGILAKGAKIGHFEYLKEYIKKDDIGDKDIGKIIAWVHILNRNQWWQKILRHYEYI